MKSPGSLLKLWNKAVAKHEQNKSTDQLGAKGQDFKKRILIPFKLLRKTAYEGLDTPEAKANFVLVQGNLLKPLRQYCRFLKTSKDEDKTKLPRYLKTVKQITVLVAELHPNDIDLREDDVSLDSLERVDVTALDAELEKPEAEEDSPPAVDAPVATAPVPDNTAKQPMPKEEDDGVARWNARLAQVQGPLKVAFQAKQGNVAELQKVFAQANSLAKQADYTQALKLLDRLEELLAQPATPTATTPTVPAEAVQKITGVYGEWQRVREAAVIGVQTLEESLRASRSPEALQIAEIVRRLAGGFPMQMDQALAQLEQAAQAGDTAKMTLLKGQARSAVKAALDYLKQHAGHIAACEENPWKISVQIARPMKQSLKTILENVS